MPKIGWESALPLTYELLLDDPLLGGLMTLGGQGTAATTPGGTVAGTLLSGTLAGISVPIFGFFLWKPMRRKSLDRKMKGDLRKRRHTLFFAPAFVLAAVAGRAGAGVLLSTLVGILLTIFRLDAPLAWDGS